MRRIKLRAKPKYEISFRYKFLYCRHIFFLKRTFESSLLLSIVSVFTPVLGQNNVVDGWQLNDGWNLNYSN